MSRRAVLVFVALAGLAGAALAGFAASRRPAPPPAPPPRRALSISIPTDRELLDVAVSADASRLAYTAIADGRSRLYVRRLDRFETEAVPGTEGARQPFFAPDGAAVGFFADGWLRTVSLRGDRGNGENEAGDGSAGDAETREGGQDRTTTVCRLNGEPAGGTWDADGRIIFGGPGNSGLQQVRADGGEPVALTVVDGENDETAHGWPHVIDERRILFTTARRGRDPRLSLLDRETGETRPLLLADGGGAFVEPSTVVFVRRGEIFAARLELDAGRDRRGAPSPRPVLRGAAGSAVGHRGLGRSRFSAARDGTLVFAPPPSAGGGNRLVRVDRSGRSEPLDDVAARHQTPRFSPDGRRVAASTVTAILRRDLWLLDLGDGDPPAVDGGGRRQPFAPLVARRRDADLRVVPHRPAADVPPARRESRRLRSPGRR